MSLPAPIRKAVDKRKERLFDLLRGKRPTGGLADFAPENSERTARIVVDSLEGARCDPRTFNSFTALSEDFDRLMSMSLPLPPSTQP